MKIDQYLITQQWGDGIQYIVGYRSTEQEGEQLRESTENASTLLYHRTGKGAKPHTHLWKLIPSTEVSR